MPTKYIIKEHEGVVEISRPTSSTVVCKIPYQDLGKSLSIENNFIVYILFAHCNDGKDKIYVGKSKNGLRNRPTSHTDKYDKWEQCFILTQHKENTFFNDGIIQYLENNICDRINELNKFDNKTNITNMGTVNENEESDCKCYLSEALTMIRILGLDLTIEDTAVTKDTSVVSEDPKKTFYLKRNPRAQQVKLGGTLIVVNSKKFILRKGAVVNPVTKLSDDHKIEKQRTTAVIVNNVLQQDEEFSSPSAAAEFIVGNTANGWVSFVNKNNQTLIDIYPNKVIS